MNSFYFFLSISLIFPTIVSCENPKFCPRRNRKSFSDESSANDLAPRVINVDEFAGRRIKIQFFYPPKAGIYRSSNEVESGSEEISAMLNEVTVPPKTTLLPSYQGDDEVQVTEQSVTEIPMVLEQEIQDPDLFCSWEFKTKNESQYLLITFNKLSAPFSDDCQDAFISMQKENGYESRWCGNRRQTNGRPMALFSKSNAKISIFRSSKASPSPPTGFSVTIESIDGKALAGRKSILRLNMLGK